MHISSSLFVPCGAADPINHRSDHKYSHDDDAGDDEKPAGAAGIIASARTLRGGN
jgi:hypothetical protein